MTQMPRKIRRGNLYGCPPAKLGFTPFHYSINYAFDLHNYAFDLHNCSFDYVNYALDYVNYALD
jgi:hypothetical protein